MCGIAGYILSKDVRSSAGHLESMLSGIRRRGPDDEGACLISRKDGRVHCYRTDATHPELVPRLLHIQNDSAGVSHDVAFAHTRYAILDLSSRGHQPFTSMDGTVTAVFQGEIYNYRELRKELMLLGSRFHSECDTEVLVEGYARWKDGLWSRMNGFWAVALYDRTDRSVVLCRDRMGVAPLYYRQTRDGLYFSSYIAPLTNINGQKATPDQDVVLGFVQTGFKDIEQATYYKEIKTLPAATMVRIQCPGAQISESRRIQYWSLPASRLTEDDISLVDATAQFRGIFFSAVDMRMRADVKLAFELSGGLDSSSIVAAAALGNNKITTYTVKVTGADEEPYARAMCSRYDLDYQVLEDIKDGFASEHVDFAGVMEEPYDNPNAYAHYQMLKKMKSDGVKVVLTGAGGDAVFAGYESSFWPKAYKEWSKQGVKAAWHADWHEFRRRFRGRENAFRTLKHYAQGPWKLFLGSPSSVTTKALEDQTMALFCQERYPKLSFDQQRQFHFETALLPYYMRSSDHFTMGIPVEHRFPFLDYRLVEFGMRLPISYLFRDGWTKYIVRKAMQPYLPSKILWRRRKMGFQFPYSTYFRNNASVFSPILQRLYHVMPSLMDRGDYERLLQRDPLQLWRLLSTGIWMEHGAKAGLL